MTHLLLEVIGRREYRGHKPGERFEAVLDPAIGRAIDRGNVKVLGTVEPGLTAGEYQIPEDWPLSAADAPLIAKGG